MSINQLYQQTIKQHSQSPVGLNASFAHTHELEGFNPSCGDELNIYIKLNSQTKVPTIVNIGFTADACAICIASCSLLCTHGLNQSLQQLQQDYQSLAHSLNNKIPLQIELLNCLTGVSSHPSRINCALLPWQTLSQLNNNIKEELHA